MPPRGSDAVHPRRRGRRRRALRLAWVGGCLALSVPCAIGWANWRPLGGAGPSRAAAGAAAADAAAGGGGGLESSAAGRRSLLQAPTASVPTTFPLPSAFPVTTFPPTILPPVEDEDDQLYPTDAFSRDQLEHGAVLLHIVGIFYMFAGLAIICDDYFVPALECITDRLQLSEDVAGATFMAAGGSAPELFTSLIGVFIAKSNVGFGTIVGSAVFNVLFVIGACAVATRKLAMQEAKKEAAASGKPSLPWFQRGLPLTWWPLARDSFFYGIDLVVLLVFFLDDEIWWWEALIMLALYGAYVCFMKFNEPIFEFIDSRIGSKVTPHEEVQVQSNGGDKQAEDGGLTRVESSAKIKKVQRDVSSTIRRESQARRSSKESMDGQPQIKRQASEGSGAGDDEEEDDGGPWHPIGAWEEGEGAVDKLKYLAFFPLNIILWITVPNCQHEELKKWFVPAFVLSICWIAFFSYFMVWWADTAGNTAGIPPEVMGLTLLAAGTSVPDLITSIVVAQAGHGDMAVSSSIGSNIFDVCFGLPLPWFIYGVTVNKGKDPIDVTSNSLGTSVLMLFGMLLATIGCIVVFGWRLNVMLGMTSTLLYFIFMTFTLLIEYEKIDGAM